MANSKKKKMTAADKRMLATRIVAGFMGALMLLGVGAMIFQLI